MGNDSLFTHNICINEVRGTYEGTTSYWDSQRLTDFTMCYEDNLFFTGSYTSRTVMDAQGV